MRFGKFTLSRYGHFTDAELSFPKPAADAPDLHLIIGPNEAGKSTFRSAVIDFIFGIDARSSFNFKHDYRELLLEASIERETSAATLQRVKGNRNTLRTSDGQIIPENELAQALSGIDKDAYGRQFALDHATLVEGGRRLLENRSDLSALLFEAASGITDFAAHQRELADRAGALWRRDNRSKTAFREALRRFQEAERAKRDAVTTAPTYTRLQRTLKHAEGDRDDARREFERLDGERAKLERLRRTAPIIARLDEIDCAEAELSPEGHPIPRLPSDAGDQLAAAREKLSRLTEAIRGHRENCDRLLERRHALAVDEAILSAAESIDALVEEAARVADFPDQISRRLTEIEGHEKRAKTEARNIGWFGAANRDDFETKLPPALHRQQLSSLIESRGALKERLDNRQKAVADLESDLADLEQQLSELSPIQLSDGLTTALYDARRLGDVEQRMAELSDAVETSAADLGELMRGLLPWSGDLDQLRTLSALSDNEIDAFQDQLNNAGQELENQKSKIAEFTNSLVTLGAELEARRAQREIVEYSALQEARQERDTRWGDIRKGQTSLPDAGDEYEHLVKSADNLADKRFSSAEAIARVEQLDTDLRTTHAQLTLAKKSLEEIESRQTGVTQAWATTMAAQGLQELTLARYRSWTDARRRALEAGRRSESAIAAHQNFEARVTSGEESLRNALELSGVNSSEIRSARIDRLTQIAENLTNDVDRSKAERANRSSRKLDLERKLDAAQAELRSAESGWAQWTIQWKKTLALCGLSDDVPGTAARDALERMAVIEDALQKIEEIETDRIGKMNRDLDVFAEHARRIASQVAPDLISETPDSIADALKSSLLKARQAVSSRQELDEQRAAAVQNIEDTEKEYSEIQATLEPLFYDAGVEDRGDHDSLKKIIDTSARMDDLDHRRRSALDELHEAADGVALETLRSDLKSTPVDSRESRMVALQLELEEIRSKLEERSSALTATQTEFEAITGSDIDVSPAARAEEDRQQAIAELVDISTDYIDTKLKAQLLRWAVDRYGAENQSPLLNRAEALFRIITGNRFASLLVDVDAEPPVLLAKRSTGELVGLDGLSDGTRDQLFMALRLAAAELQMEDGTPLPFIADDLFINFDDERAVEGFRVLAELGHYTQVLYLSHHEHLVALANKAIPNGVNVIRL